MPNNDQIRDKTTEFNDKLKEMSKKLELDEKQAIIGIDFKESIKLGGNLERKNIFVVKIKDDDGEIHHIIIDSDINRIANINKEGKIELSDEEIKKWEKFIGTKEFQNAEQKKMYDFEKKYVLDEYKMDENSVGVGQALPENNNLTNDRKSAREADLGDQQNQEEQKAAEALNINETQIVAMIKIEDRENFGQAINQKLHADSYIVKYGNNKTKIMQMDSKGKLNEIAGLESNEFNQDVMEQLNIDKRKENQKIKAGDLKTIKTEDNKCNFVVVREKDPKKGIVIVNSRNSTKIYTFDDEGKETLKEIETSIKYQIDNNGNDKNDRNSVKNEVHHVIPNNTEKEEYEGRTLWGDAYARQRR